MPPVQTRPITSMSSPLSPHASHPRPSHASAQPPRPKSAGANTTHRPLSTAASAPYMVALSGWPEPVYISNPGTRSRPTTPLPHQHSHQTYDGIPSSSTQPNGYSQRAPPTSIASGIVPDESIFSKSCMYNINNDEKCPLPNHPNHASKHTESLPPGLILNTNNTPTQPDQPKHQDQPYRYNPDSSHIHSSPPQSHRSESAFPTSSTRGTPHPSPPSSTFSSPQSHRVDPKKSTFRDPRLAPHVAVLSNRGALPLTPNWSYSTPHPSQVQAHTQPGGVGVRVQAGQRGTGILVMRSTPDVYPLPQPYPKPTGPIGVGAVASNMARTSSGGRIGVATEVYPRDPDSALLWGSEATTHSRMGSTTASQSEDDHDVRMDEA